jgi:hypothetical protein
MSEKPQQQSNRVIITGAWERSGQYGPFYTGNVKKSELMKVIQDMPGEDLQLLVSSVSEKKTENHPDILVSLQENTYIKKA